MTEAEEAWRLYRQLQQFSDRLWDHYESAFMENIADERQENGYVPKEVKEELPF